MAGKKMDYITFRYALIIVISLHNCVAEEKYISISNETKLEIITSLTLMNYNFDRKPMDKIAFGCRNQISLKLLSQFPFSEVRWKHNGHNLVVQASRMTLFGTDILNIQQLVPSDSGVYLCVISPNSQHNLVVAFHTLVVGENWIHVIVTDTFTLLSNSQEIGKIFPKATRTWTRNLNTKNFTVEEKPAEAEDTQFTAASDEKFSGIWLCVVTHKDTNRKWTTARYKVIIDSAPPIITRIRIFVKTRRTESIAILTAITFGLAVIVNGITKLLEIKQKRHEKEIGYLKKALGIPEPWEELERKAGKIPRVPETSKRPLLNKNNAARILGSKFAYNESSLSESESEKDELFVRPFA